MKIFGAVASLIETIDRKTSWTAIAFCATPLVVLFLFPTGILNSNEEYYFQLAAKFLTAAQYDDNHAIIENAHHLFLSNLVIGIPVRLFGYETANTYLRIVTSVCLALSFAWLLRSLRLTALDGIIGLAAFWLVGQELFGGEWIFQSVEGKVFAYIFVFLGIAQAILGKWRSSVAAFILATYFHVLVGGFWAIAILLWSAVRTRDIRTGSYSIVSYALLVAPLAALILLQQSASQPLAAGDLDTMLIYSTLRVPHHIAPFSDKLIIWSWTTGIVLALGLLAAHVVSLSLKLSDLTRQFAWLVIGLLVYLLLSLLSSATDLGVRLLGQFYLFRPSALTLLLAILTLVAIYRDTGNTRSLIVIASCIVLPVAVWSASKEKIETFLWRGYDHSETARLVDHVHSATSKADTVLIQPGRDGEPVERALSRLLDRPTLQNWYFIPTLPADIEKWYRRDQFRHSVFSKGCDASISTFNVGALILRNADLPPVDIITSCGESVWMNDDYTVLAIHDYFRK